MIRLLMVSSRGQEAAFPEGLDWPQSVAVSFLERVEEGERVLRSGWFDWCILDCPEAGMGDLDGIRQLRSVFPDGFLAVLTPFPEEEWERIALKAGADLVLREGVAGAALKGLLRQREGRRPQREGGSGATGLGRQPALELFRDVSRVLSQRGGYRAMAEQFVLKLRDLIGVHKLCLFLESPPGSPWLSESTSRRELACITAYGISPELRDCLRLSRNGGLGRLMLESPRVIRSDAPEDPEVLREIEIPGGVVAVPVNDRERNIGVALFGERLMGQTYSGDDLQLIALLLEELGVALRNEWDLDLRERQEGLLKEVFSALDSGCLVLDEEGRHLQVNRAFLDALGHRGLNRMGLTQDALPGEIRDRLEALRAGESDREPFVFVDELAPAKTFQARVIPVGGGREGRRAVMVLLEDVTQREEQKHQDIEESRSRLTSLIAKRFAHEIRNSLVPLSTHLQLFEDRFADADYQESLRETLDRETRRIQRFTDQMLYVSPREAPASRQLRLGTILRDAWTSAGSDLDEAGSGSWAERADGIHLNGHGKSLEQAFHELILNAVQASPEHEAPRIEVELEDSGHQVEIRILDRGEGFPPGMEDRVFEPFFTTKNTGVGLGLTVARNIILSHGGSLELVSAHAPYQMMARVKLPCTTAQWKSESAPASS